MSLEGYGKSKLSNYFERLYALYVEWSRNDLACKFELNYGPVVAKFRENDPELLSFISLDYSQQDVENVAFEYLDWQQRALKKVTFQSIIEEKRLDLLNRECELLSNQGFEQWFKQFFLPWLHAIELKVDANHQRGFCMVYLGYRNYCFRVESVYNRDRDKLVEIYKNILSKDSSLYKYGIIEIDSKCELLPIDPPRVFDGRINMTLMTANVNKEFLEVLSCLQNKGFIGELYLRLSNSISKIFRGKYELQVLMEAIEFGKLFAISGFGNVPLTKLYSKNFGDTLWIQVSKTDITFEELCETDIHVENSIITQVIHLQYLKKDETLVISHIDHEYIYYDELEYAQRKSDARIKGTNQKRLKSFKIDKACIPLDYPIPRTVYEPKDIDCEAAETVPFLIYVLKCYFIHHDLIDEYFQAVISKQ